MLVRLCSYGMRTPDAGDAVGNGDARQAVQPRMRIPDAGDAVGNGDARQAAAAQECVSPMLVTLRPSIVAGISIAPVAVSG